MQNNDNKSSYDSTKDAEKHIKIIQGFMDILIKEIENRAENHDKSKFDSPEKETYDEYIPKLREEKYGSDKYNALREEMRKKGLKHHFETNRHHPEHFKNGFNDMTLVDIIETFSDWVAASRNSDTGFMKGLDINSKKFNMDPMLIKIFENTFNEYFNK